RIISQAIGSRAKILVYGDYDADGITGTACLYRFLRDLGAEVGCMVPHRLLDGYGVHKHLIERAVHEGYRCIITVDCGTTDVAPLRYALKSGLSVVVTDHHRVPSDLNVDWPLINPKRLPSEDGLWELSGSSMAFLLAVSIRRFLREKGFFRRRREPDLKGYLGLVTIGMVADRVNLSGNQTRLLVKNGLEELNRSEEFVLTYLKELSSLETRRLNTEDIGFRLAPRINAPGRIGDPKVALEALIGDDEKRVRSLVDLMESLNNRRRTMEEELLKEVENEIRVKYREPPLLILCHKEDWHEGILGLVASKVSTNHYRPTLILRSKGGILKGSGRSIPEVDLFELIKTQSHLLLKFGGHSGAVGLSLDLSALDSFEEALSSQLQERLNLTSLVPTPYIDMELDLRELTIEDVEALKR
ncbi:MAG: single-stranded-DNA-specific exonuclease RecJ, partial [Desulfatiglandales bacterium]